MLKQLLLLATCCVATLPAAYDGIQFSYDGPCVWVYVTSDATMGAYSLRVDPSDGDPSNGVRTREVTDSNGRGSHYICSLVQNTTYEVYFTSANDGVFDCPEPTPHATDDDCTDCTFFSSPQSTGFDCDVDGNAGTSEYPTFTTATTFATAPTTPTLPSHTWNGNARRLTGADTTRTLTSECADDAATEAEFLVHYDAARALSSDQVHEIVIPSGCVVTASGQMTFGDWTGSGSQGGLVYVICGGDDKLYPPEGVRIDPGWTANACYFRADGTHNTPFQITGGELAFSKGVHWDSSGAPPGSGTNPLVSALINFPGAHNISFDRNLVDCSGYNWWATCLSSSTVIGLEVYNSFFYAPQYGCDDATPSTCSNDVGRVIVWNDGQDHQIRNISIANAAGILLGGDNGCSTRQVQDITVSRVSIHSPAEMQAGTTDSDGNYYNHRHQLEFKCGIRLLIEGVHVANQWRDGETSGVIVTFKGIGRGSGGAMLDARGTYDITVRGSVIEKAPSGFTFLQDSNDYFSPPIRRVSITHTLIKEIDYLLFESDPNQASTAFFGHTFNLNGQISDVLIQNNTIPRQRARGIGTLLDVGGGFKSRVHFKDNLVVFNEDPATNVFGIETEDGGKTLTSPSCASLSGVSLWNCAIATVGANGAMSADTGGSTFGSNTIIPCLEDQYLSDPARDTAMASSDTADKVTVAEAQAYFTGNIDSPANTFPAGADCDTATDAAFASAGSYESANSDGADLDTIRQYTGEMGDLTLSPITGGVRFSYDGPLTTAGAEDSCTVDVVLKSSGWTNAGAITRTADGGGSGTRTVDVTGLSNGTYISRVLCPAEQLRSEFTLTGI